MQDEFVILKQALKSFENKNFKKSVKLCEEGLKSFPHSSEFLSLKAICLHSMGKISEGYDLVKKSLQQNTKSGLSWHLYAIMLKNDKNFVDSIKSMRTSLKFDESNISLRKEMSSLMLVCQDFESFLDTRLMILSNSNLNFINISSVALGFYLNQLFLDYLVFIKFLILLTSHSGFLIPNLIEIFIKCGCLTVDSSLSPVIKCLTTTTSPPRNFTFKPKDFNEIYSVSKHFYSINDCNNALNILFSLGKFNPFHERNLAYLECLINIKIAQKNRTNIDVSIGKIVALFKIDEGCGLADLLEKLKYFQSIELLYNLALAHYFWFEFKLALEIVGVIIKILEEISIDFLEFINYSFRRCSFRNFSELLAMDNVLLRFSHVQLSMILKFKLYLIDYWNGKCINPLDFSYMFKLARKFCWKDYKTLSFFYVICIYEKRNILIEKIYLRLCYLGLRPCFKREFREDSNLRMYVFDPLGNLGDLDYFLYLRPEYILNNGEYVDFITCIINDSKENCLLFERNSVQIQNFLDNSFKATDSSP